VTTRGRLCLIRVALWWSLVLSGAPTFAAEIQSAGTGSESGNVQTDKEKAAALVREVRNGLVVVEGKSSNASGFIAEFKGRKFLVTNAHVLAGTKDAHLKLLDNQPLKLGAAMLAVGHDLLMVTVLEGGTGIPTAEFVATEAKTGDAVVVPGNPGGTGVVNPLLGDIAGIGPERVEVSAPFEPGSSGSPIIHLNAGKVIGVATYLRIRSPSSSEWGISSLGEVRRFGFRLDSVKKWEAVDFAADAFSRRPWVSYSLRLERPVCFAPFLLGVARVFFLRSTCLPSDRR
jgi:S1-C subfamily serine protease